MESCWKRGSDDWTVCCSLCLALSHSNLASLSQLSVCLSFAVKSGISFRGSFSSQSFTLPVTHLLQSCVFISSSFSCKRSRWQVLISSVWQSEHNVCSYLSPPFSCFCSSVSADIARSLPPIGRLGQPWSRISTAFCTQPVYTTVSACHT